MKGLNGIDWQSMRYWALEGDCTENILQVLIDNIFSNSLMSFVLNFYKILKIGANSILERSQSKCLSELQLNLFIFNISQPAEWYWIRWIWKFIKKSLFEHHDFPHWNIPNITFTDSFRYFSYDNHRVFLWSSRDLFD